MSKKYKISFLVLLFLLLAGMCVLWFVHHKDVAMFNPKGWIAAEEYKLIQITTYLMLIVVIPAFFLIAYFAWRYREGHKRSKGDYRPNWDNNNLIEAIWWGVPGLIILVLGVITWKTCHQLDPFRPIVNGKPPMTIQVIALRWKWLFLYPEQRIAAVNYFRFPENTPVRFEITSDAPMNSFWIPELGGQIYAMPGMKTELNLISDTVGKFRGASANLSGKGFAGMTFIAEASTEQGFEEWVHEIKRSKPPFSFKDYAHLVKPSENVPPTSYVLTEENLYHRVVMQYMRP